MKLFFTALLVALCCIQQVAAVTLPKSVRDELMRANIPLSSVGIVVQKVDARIPLLKQNAAQAMNPASTMKLLTTYAGLEMLGPAYQWKTEAFLDGKLENGVLQGNLIFKGYGDPKLTIEQFWMWLRELRQRGLREIRGNVVLDRSFFATLDHDPNEFDNDPTRAYNVGPNALLLNFNALRLRLIPNVAKMGTTLTEALLEPDLFGYLITNRITTAAQSPCAGGDNYTARLEQRSIVLEGSIPTDCGEVEDYFALLSHDEYFFAVFSALWKELGGTLQGELRTGNAPSDQMAFSTHLSPPLSEVIRDINKFSSNIMARQLFLTLGEATPMGAPSNADNRVQKYLLLGEVMDMLPAEGVDLTPTLDVPTSNVPTSGVPPSVSLSLADDTQLAAHPASLANQSAYAPMPRPAASIPRSTAALQQWLQRERMIFPELVLENGAGLSRKERISASHLAELLRHAARSRYAAELESSLPILGMDGTMKKRFKDHEIAGSAHLKSGLLSGVKAIAGYVQGRSGQQWVVVFIVNHPNAALAQPAQDALIEWVHKVH